MRGDGGEVGGRGRAQRPGPVREMGVESVERAAYRAEGHALTAERADRDAGNVQRQRPQLLREQRPECLTDRGERAGEDQELGVQGENERGDSGATPAR